MFELKVKEPVDFYEHCYSEYFIEKFPTNFFDTYIDIGCCGTLHKWHINHIGNDNPSTKCIGFEPEEKSFNLINDVCKNLENVFLEQSFFGRDISLSKLVEKYNIDTDKNWCFSCDCEGDEKYIFNNDSEMEILKTASHICFELHPKHSNISHKEFIEKIKQNFNDTHKIVTTYLGNNLHNPYYHDRLCGTNNFSIIIVKKEIFDIHLKEKLKNLKYNFDNELNMMVNDNGNIKRTEHSIIYLN
jgi:hypothetical protein